MHPGWASPCVSAGLLGTAQGHPAGSWGASTRCVPALAHSLPCWTQAHLAVTWDVTTRGSSGIWVLQAPTAWTQHGFTEPPSPMHATAREGRDSQRAWLWLPWCNKPIWAQSDPDALLKLKSLRPQWWKYNTESSLRLSCFTTLQLFCSSSSTAGKAASRDRREQPWFGTGETLHWGRQRLCYETAPLSSNSWKKVVTTEVFTAPPSHYSLIPEDPTIW